MKKFSLLLLDANVVIHLFKLGIWEALVAQCDVHLSRTVAEHEAHFYETEDGERHDFDLEPYIADSRISVIDVAPSDLIAFKNSFGPAYFEKLDPGEAESLAFLMDLDTECWLCSADKIVYRILGALGRAEAGISLEEVLQQIGLSRQLPRQFTKPYREQWTAKGFQEGLWGTAFKKGAT